MATGCSRAAAHADDWILKRCFPGAICAEGCAFHRGLNETGFVEGQNLAIDNRWAEEHYDRLPALAADLVGRRVALIVTYTDAAALAAKAATTTIPIVFVNGGDPVRAGIVHSLNRPGDNITGVSFYGVDLPPKQLSLLHDLVPKAVVIGLLIDQNVPDAVAQVPAVQEAARNLGLQLIVLKARVAGDIMMHLRFSSGNEPVHLCSVTAIY